MKIHAVPHPNETHRRFFRLFANSANRRKFCGDVHASKLWKRCAELQRLERRS